MKSSTTALLFACVMLAGCSQLASPINELTPTPTPESEDATTSPPTTEPSTSELPTPETAETRTPTAARTQPRPPTATATTIAPTIPTPPATTTAVLTTATPSATTVRTPELPTATAMTTRTASPPPASVSLAIVTIDARNETVTFRNVGERPLDLGGYVVDFDDGQRYTFPRYTLEPGATVTLHTGRGDSAGSELYAGFFYPVLNADGDTLLVVSPTGEIVLARRVPATPGS